MKTSTKQKESDNDTINTTGERDKITRKEKHLEDEQVISLFHHITTQSLAVIYILNLAGPSIEFMSPSIVHITGYSSEYLLRFGNNVIEQILHPEDIDLYHNHLEKIKQPTNSTIEAVQYRVKKKGGGYVWLSTNMNVLERDRQNRPTKLICVSQDETKQKETELKLERANEELKRFAYVSSHDLKEPLNTVISLIDVIKMEMDNNPQIVDLLDLLDLCTVRMKQLIDDLLSYSLLEQQQLKTDDVDLNELLTWIKQDLDTSIVESEATIHIPLLPIVRGDATQLRQLFQNLISNAIKYRIEAPNIKIKAEEQAQHWLFSIADNGIGIAEKNISKIFEVFQKLHARHVYEGTGIGLASCVRIVGRHQGKIWAESEIGKGSTFYFTIAK